MVDLRVGSGGPWLDHLDGVDLGGVALEGALGELGFVHSELVGLVEDVARGCFGLEMLDLVLGELLGGRCLFVEISGFEVFSWVEDGGDDLREHVSHAFVGCGAVCVRAELSEDLDVL